MKENKFQLVTPTNMNSAFSATANITCGVCGLKGHSREECFKVGCSNCGNTGHIEINCWRDLVCTKCLRKGHPSDKCWKEVVCRKFN